MPKVTTTGRADTERRILESTAELVSRSGLDEVSMRSVAAASGLQTPALYRIFEDKDALLRRLTAFAFEGYFAAKRDTLTIVDPIGDLDRGWDLHIGFGLDNPHLYPLMFAGPWVEPATGTVTAAEQAYDMLTDVVRRIAAQGMLTTTVEAATIRIHAATLGATFFLLGLPPDRRDPSIVTPLRDSVYQLLITGRKIAIDPGSTLLCSARAVLANLPDRADSADSPGGLRPTEIALLRDWLERIAK